MNLIYDIDSNLTVELREPSQSLARVFERQMDPLEPISGRAGSPDLIVERLGEDTFQRPFLLGNSGDNEICRFGPGAFLAHSGGAISLDFESVGCESCVLGYSAEVNPKRLVIDYLRPAMHMRLLGKGMVAVHGAALEHRGQGIVFAGWAESGKSEAALSLMSQGASFISDKWSILSPISMEVSRFPTPITVRSWMLERLPSLSEGLRPADRVRVSVSKQLNKLFTGLSNLGGPAIATRAFSLSSAYAGMASGVSMTPSELQSGFDTDASPNRASSAKLSKVFLLITTPGGSGVNVQAASAGTVAARLAACARHERRRFFDLYTKYKYANPESRNEILERSQEYETAILQEILSNVDVFTVETPFPFRPREFYDAVRPFC